MKRVLLAEDDIEMRMLIQDVLSRDGWEVVEARNGTELLSLIAGQVYRTLRRAPAIDLIISDVRMPGLSGLDVLAAIRRADWAVPVILITAFGERIVHLEAKRLGAVAVLDKPFALDRLRAVAASAAGDPRPEA
jgi:CheY-like chemotaxis protein